MRTDYSYIDSSKELKNITSRRAGLMASRKSAPKELITLCSEVYSIIVEPLKPTFGCCFNITVTDVPGLNVVFNLTFFNATPFLLKDKPPCLNLNDICKTVQFTKDDFYNNDNEVSLFERVKEQVTTALSKTQV